MKPTTYYVQTPQIDKLTRNYGSRFEGMELEDKHALRVVLSHYVYVHEVIDSEDCDLVESFALSVEQCDATTPDFHEVILPTLGGIGIDDANGLIEAITAQLRA